MDLPLLAVHVARRDGPNPPAAVPQRVLAGSNTVSNLMLSQYPYSVAQALGVSGAIMVAAQSVGAAAGNMIAIHNVVAASATVGLLGREGITLRRTVIPTIDYVLLAGLLTLAAIRVLKVTDPLLGVPLP